MDAAEHQRGPLPGTPRPGVLFPPSGAGQAPSLELLGVDYWFDAEGMQADYADPAMNRLLEGLFTAAPEGGVWKKPEGAWAEW